MICRRNLWMTQSAISCQAENRHFEIEPQRSFVKRALSR
jgi:hypothetical protein